MASENQPKAHHGGQHKAMSRDDACRILLELKDPTLQDLQLLLGKEKKKANVKNEVQELAVKCYVDTIRLGEVKVQRTEYEMNALLALFDEKQIGKKLQADVKSVSKAKIVYKTQDVGESSSIQKHENPPKKEDETLSASRKHRNESPEQTIEGSRSSSTVSNIPVDNTKQPKAENGKLETKSEEMDDTLSLRQTKELKENGKEAKGNDEQIYEKYNKIEEQEKDILAKNEEVQETTGNDEKIDEKDNKIQEQEKEILAKNEEIQRKDNKIQQQNEQIQQLQNEIEGARKGSESEKETADELQRKLNESRQNLDDFKRKYHEVIEEADIQKKNRDKDIQALKKELKATSEERDIIRDRFVKLSGSKLSDQNTDVADLNDPYRALNLSEMFRQLYSKEWTYAKLVLGKNRKENNILFLLSILKSCWKKCDEITKEQFDILRNVFLYPAQNKEQFESPKHPQTGHNDFVEEEKMAALGLRKQVAVRNTVVDEIKQVVYAELKSQDFITDSSKVKQPEIRSYIDKCAEICWFMVVHNPPLFIKLDTKHGDKFDKALFNEYSADGEIIDYVVWPPLFIAENKELMEKGVAQPQMEDVCTRV